jgi:cell division protein FtsQ
MTAGKVVPSSGGRLRKPWVWVVVGVGVLALLVTALRFTPYFAVSEVKVSGNEQVTSDEVLAAADVSDGAPLLTAPLSTIEERVESLDAVADARAVRDWPNTLKIVVRERRPVGFVTTSTGVGLIGSDGLIYRHDERTPEDLPRLPSPPIDDVGARYSTQLDAAGVAAFNVAVALPQALQRSVESVDAADERSVTLTFDDGVVVRWGSSGESDEKSGVVGVMRQRAGWATRFTVVDVSSPDAPALSAPD